MQLCDAFDMPLLSLFDTPGMMVGPEVESDGAGAPLLAPVRRGANLTVPLFAVILRKAYGLGALAMAGGSGHASLLIVAWPTGEFGAMGLEGGVKLGYRKECSRSRTPPSARPGSTRWWRRPTRRTRR